MRTARLSSTASLLVLVSCAAVVDGHEEVVEKGGDLTWGLYAQHLRIHGCFDVTPCDPLLVATKGYLRGQSPTRVDAGNDVWWTHFRPMTTGTLDELVGTWTVEAHEEDWSGDTHPLFSCQVDIERHHALEAAFLTGRDCKDRDGNPVYNVDIQVGLRAQSAIQLEIHNRCDEVTELRKDFSHVRMLMNPRSTAVFTVYPGDALRILHEFTNVVRSGDPAGSVQDPDHHRYVITPDTRRLTISGDACNPCEDGLCYD